MADAYIAFLPVIIIFAILGWITIFLETWRRWPKLETDKRIAMSISNATFLTFVLISAVYIFLWLTFSRGT